MPQVDFRPLYSEQLNAGRFARPPPPQSPAQIKTHTSERSQSRQVDFRPLYSEQLNAGASPDSPRAGGDGAPSGSSGDAGQEEIMSLLDQVGVWVFRGDLAVSFKNCRRPPGRSNCER